MARRLQGIFHNNARLGYSSSMSDLNHKANSY